MSETREQRAERVYARQEERLDEVNAARVRRGPVSLVVVLLGVSLVVGITAAIDLRRLATPQGAALAWTSAALFGDCTAYRRLSLPDPQALVPDTRTEAELCAALQQRTADARSRPTQYGVTAGEAVEAGDTATVPIGLATPDGKQVVSVPLVREGDEWRVLRTRSICVVVGCA